MINNEISSTELSMIAFLCFISPLAFLRSNEMNNNIADTVYSLITTVGICLLLLLIVICFKNINVSKSKFVSLLYVLYFTFILISDIDTVTKMLTNTIIPDGNPVFIAIFMLITAIYGALKGVESLGRSANIIFFFFIFGVLFLILSALKNVKAEEYVIPFENGYNAYFSNTLLILSNTSFIPMVLILRQCVKEKLKFECFVYIFIAAVIGVIFMLEIEYCLGYYALTQEYPLYTLTAVTKADPLKRLDLIFTFIFIISSVLRFSVSLLCIKILFGNVFNGSSAFPFFYGIVILVLTVVMISVYEIRNTELLNFIRVFLLFVFSLIIPVCFIIKRKRRKV